MLTSGAVQAEHRAKIAGLSFLPLNNNHSSLIVTGSPFRKTEFTMTEKSDEKIEVNIMFTTFIWKACNFL